MTEQKRKKAELVKRLIAAGWNPPTPTSHIVARIADDIERVSTIEDAVTDKFKPTLKLSERQLLIIRLLAEGHTRDETAALIGCGVETIKTSLKDAFTKLGAKNIAHAVALCIRNGDLDPTEATNSVGWEQAA